MKKSILLFIAIGFMFNVKSIAQEKEKLFGIKFSGFVKNDFIFDTRQVISAREGHFLLYPKNVKLDMEGKDINAKASFNYMVIQSRLTGKITGPDAFGAKTSGVIEGDFLGRRDSYVNSFRMRHAFIKLNWKTTEVLVGQYWHIMFVTGCFPGTVSFNTGVPIAYLGRNPQIRISQKVGAITFTGVVASQFDFVSPGGSETLRNAILPDLSGRISYSNENLYIGVNAGYKQLLPRLETDESYKATATIGGIITQAFLKYSTAHLTLKLKAAYSQNSFEGLQIGGYAVQKISNPMRDYRIYTPINTVSYWTDVQTNGKKIQVGLFAGYIKNLGSKEEIEAMDLFGSYSRGSDIASVYRVSPRIILNSGKVRLAAEYELTAAEYGETISNKGIPLNTNTVFNNRFLVAVYYFF